MNLDTTQQKVAVLEALDNMSVFLSNNKEHMEPSRLAQLIIDQEELTKKTRVLFLEEKNLDSVLEKLTNEVNNQEELINKQKRLLEVTEA
ncbi:hypothetical protein AACB36_00145, partial [Enterococcus faecalis]|uniref:hypothetical protein n=2 Tax=cellular organisms TaxID=131567 RepID=UPI00317D5C3B